MDPATVQILLMVFQGFLASLPQSVAAMQALKRMSATGSDPTADDWAKITAAMAEVHHAVQAAMIGRAMQPPPPPAPPAQPPQQEAPIPGGSTGLTLNPAPDPVSAGPDTTSAPAEPPAAPAA